MKTPQVCLMAIAMATISAGAACALSPCVGSNYAEIMAVLMDPVIWDGPDGPIFTEDSSPDHDWNDIRDDYEVALACAAMCDYPSAQDAYDYNYARGVARDGHDVGWGTLAGAYGMRSSGIGVIQWWGVKNMLPWKIGNVEPCAANSDYDGDGLTNKQEYDLVVAQGGGPLDFADAATKGCEPTVFEEIFGDFVAEAYVQEGHISDTDLDEDGLPDVYDARVLSAAICGDAAVEALFDDNRSVAVQSAPRESLASLAAVYATIGSMETVTSVFGVSVTGLSPWGSAGDLLGANGDYDEDGLDNRVEYGLLNAAAWPGEASAEDYADSAMTPSAYTSCSYLKDRYLRAMFGLQRGEGGPIISADGTPDHNLNDIPDEFELALLAVGLCERADAEQVFAANLALANSIYGNARNGLPEVAAAYATMGQEGIDGAVVWLLGIPPQGFASWSSAKTATEPLSADGDYDVDGFSNLEEYEYVSARGGSPEQYANAASGGFGGPTPVPAAGVFGLIAAAAAILLGGGLRVLRQVK